MKSKAAIDFNERAEMMKREAIKDIRFYIHDGIDESHAVEMVLSASILSSKLKQDITNNH